MTSEQSSLVINLRSILGVISEEVVNDQEFNKTITELDIFSKPLSEAFYKVEELLIEKEIF